MQHPDFSEVQTTVSDFDLGLITEQEAIHRVREIMAGKSMRRKPEARPIPRDTLAEIHAERLLLRYTVLPGINSHPGVINFRKRYPNSSSLKIETFPAWFRRMRSIDLREASLSDDRISYLSTWSKPLSTRSRRVAVAGCTRELFELAAAVSMKFRISLPQAIACITSNHTAAPPHTFSIWFEARSEFPELSRLTLEVHPRTSVKEVALAYRRFKDSIGLKDGHVLSNKLAELGMFVITERGSGITGKRLTWRTMFKVWNIRHPSLEMAKKNEDGIRRMHFEYYGEYPPPKEIKGDPWFYKHESNFRRDALRAARALQNYYTLTPQQLAIAEEFF